MNFSCGFQRFQFRDYVTMFNSDETEREEKRDRKRARPPNRSYFSELIFLLLRYSSSFVVPNYQVLKLLFSRSPLYIEKQSNFVDFLFP